jgi:hypothetical protein
MLYSPALIVASRIESSDMSKERVSLTYDPKFPLWIPGSPSVYT